jgi:hypothetical protein
MSADRKGAIIRVRSSKLLAFIGIFLLWWIPTALVYRHTQSNFLRAESGWFLFLSHSDPAVQRGFEKVLLTKSYHGHFAPSGFLVEFATAKLVGTYAGFWRWRQITVLALLAATLFLFVRNSGYALQLSRLKASMSAASLTVILIFQPQMREFVAWPFMILQLFWLLLSVLALMSLVQMAQHPSETKWSWLAAAAAYASLHFLGLGMATVAATAVGMAGIWWTLRSYAPVDAAKIAVPLLSMIAIATLHGVVMVKFPRAEVIAASPGLRPLSFLMASLGFMPNFALATLRSPFSMGQPTPDAWQSSQDWPYGLAILLGFAFLLNSAFLRCLREATARNRTRFILRSFASVSFLTMIALISLRQWHEPSSHGFAEYLAGPRYLIPGTFALAGVMAELLFLAASAPVFLNVLLNFGLGVCAVLGNLLFAAHVYPKVAPRSMMSHERAWQAIVAMARECRRADLPIPNVPLGALTQEFTDWDLKLFEPLLRADLQEPTRTQFLEFAPWDGSFDALPEKYHRDVPSLAPVKKRLFIETKK